MLKAERKATTPQQCRELMQTIPWPQWPSGGVSTMQGSSAFLRPVGDEYPEQRDVLYLLTVCTKCTYTYIPTQQRCICMSVGSAPLLHTLPALFHRFLLEKEHEGLKDITDFLSCRILLFSISNRKLLWWYITSRHFRFLPLMPLITVQKISLIRKLI